MVWNCNRSSTTTQHSNNTVPHAVQRIELFLSDSWSYSRELGWGGPYSTTITRHVLPQSLTVCYAHASLCLYTRGNLNQLRNLSRLTHRTFNYSRCFGWKPEHLEDVFSRHECPRPLHRPPRIGRCTERDHWKGNETPHLLLWCVRLNRQNELSKGGG